MPQDKGYGFPPKEICHNKTVSMALNTVPAHAISLPNAIMMAQKKTTTRVMREKWHLIRIPFPYEIVSTDTPGCVLCIGHTRYRKRLHFLSLRGIAYGAHHRRHTKIFRDAAADLNGQDATPLLL